MENVDFPHNLNSKDKKIFTSLTYDVNKPVMQKPMQSE